jgi:hypothetical protein
VQACAKALRYPSRAIVYVGNDEDDYLCYLPDNREIDVCHGMMVIIGYPKLEDGPSAMPKGDLADWLAYNSLIVRLFHFYFGCQVDVFKLWRDFKQLIFAIQGLILSKALKAQNDAEEIAHMAIDNLMSKVISLRHKNEEQDDMLNTLANDLI